MGADTYTKAERTPARVHLNTNEMKKTSDSRMQALSARRHSDHKALFIARNIVSRASIHGTLYNVAAI